MKISLIVLGATDEDYLKKGINIYVNKISKYYNFNYVEIASLKNIKNLSTELQKEKEADTFMQYLKPSDYIILLDETGTLLASRQFANHLQINFNKGLKHIIFLVGGPYGFGQEIINRSNEKLALSKMTFSHQMVRSFLLNNFTELAQLLRAKNTITTKTYLTIYFQYLIVTLC